MAKCPECGGLLSRTGGDDRYYCENRNCVVVFVRNPHEPSIMRVAYTSFAREVLHKPKGFLRKIFNG